MKTVYKKIGGAIVDILIVVLVLLSIIISISSITARANNGVPDLFGYSPFSVQSESMQPTINEGDYIFVEKCDAEALKVIMASPKWKPGKVGGAKVRATLKLPVEFRLEKKGGKPRFGIKK